MKEALWFSRVIRLFGVKELFDVVVNLCNWLLQYRSDVAVDAQQKSIPHRELFWASFSLVAGIVLLRYATEIALVLVGRRGPRRLSHSLSPSGNTWLSLGVRCMAFYILIQSFWFLLNGFFASARETRLTLDLLGRPSFHYFVWWIVYAGIGAILSIRPDIIGIFLPSREVALNDNLGGANRAPLRTPGSVTPAADAPVAPPPGVAGL